MRRAARWIGWTAALGLLVCGPASAQSVGRRPPEHAFQLRLGGFFPDGGGPLWNDVEQTFTLDASDLDGVIFGLSLETSLNNYVEAGVHVDFFEEAVRSEDREFVDEDGFPILHDTELEMIPLVVDLRWLPSGRYRVRPGGVRVLRPAFYLGALAGVNFWQYTEVGDFVDVGGGPSVFFGHFEEDGEAFQVGALAGFELPIDPRFHFAFEARYTWADDDLEGDLASLESIELGGLSVTAGASFRF